MVLGTRDTCQRFLAKACIVVGDEVLLARKLGAPVDDVVDWLLGNRPVPTDYFLKAVDIVLADTKHQIGETRGLLADLRRRHRRR